MLRKAKLALGLPWTLLFLFIVVLWLFHGLHLYIPLLSVLATLLSVVTFAILPALLRQSRTSKGKTIDHMDYAALAVIGIIVASSLVLITPVDEFIVTQPIWAVEVGDKFNYTVSHWGFWFPRHTVYLDEDIVTVEVIDLPFLLKTSFLYTGVLVRSVIETTKTNLTFRGGDDTGEALMNNVFSRMILPVDAWTVIDSLFPDVADRPFQSSTFLARPLDDVFYFGYSSGHIDTIMRWGGSVSYITGIPLNITLWYEDLSWPGGHYYGMTMKLTA